MGELIFLGIILFICVVFFSLTFSFPVSILDKSGGAGLFPRIVIIFLIAVVLGRVFEIIRKKEKKHFVFIELFKGPQLAFFLGIVLYILCFNKLGYVLSTLLFGAISVNGFYRYAYGNWGSVKSIVIRNLCIIIFASLMFFFFSEVLNILLPPPMWM